MPPLTLSGGSGSGGSPGAFKGIVLRPEAPPYGSAGDGGRSGSESSSTIHSGTPVDVPTTPTGSVFSTASSLGEATFSELFQMELQDRLSRGGGRKLVIPRTPDVPLKSNATKEQVTEWLKLKGFNDQIVARLTGFTGETLLALKMADMQKLLQDQVPLAEIRRLDGQIEIQRCTHPFNTMGTAEFRAVIERARRRTEEALEEEVETPAEVTAC